MKEKAYRSAKPKEIRRARKLIQNPWAYLDGEGGFTALVKQNVKSIGSCRINLERILDGASAASDLTKRNFTDQQVEHISRRLLRAMWRYRFDLWPDENVDHPLQLLDPARGCQAIGMELSLIPDLGKFKRGRQEILIAGIIDQGRSRIEISERPSRAERNFTAAHELGHALMHRHTGLHRDRPIGEACVSDRAPFEQEADKFAACYLMPRRQVVQALDDRYGETVFRRSDEEIELIFGAAWTGCSSRRERARFIAGHTGRNIDVSLAELFQVTVSAMAIRLEEIGAIPE